MDKIEALRKAGIQNWQAEMHWSERSILDLNWWLNNVTWRVKKIRISPPKIELACDASGIGWGGVLNLTDGRKFVCNGKWSEEDLKLSINYRELKAIYLSLVKLQKALSGQDLLIFSDNITAVSNVKKMGSVKSRVTNDLAQDIWKFLELRKIFAWISHKPGVENVDADYQSRCLTDDTEWGLNPNIFRRICNAWGVPDIDLFASKNLHVLECYCSWVPDPDAFFIDAFCLDWSRFSFVYAFPPFRLVGRVLQKIQKEKVKAVVVSPAWEGQAWAGLLKKMKRRQIYIPKNQDNLISRRVVNPLADSALWLTLC